MRRDCPGTDFSRDTVEGGVRREITAERVRDSFQLVSELRREFVKNRYVEQASELETMRGDQDIATVVAVPPGREDDHGYDLMGTARVKSHKLDRK